MLVKLDYKDDIARRRGRGARVPRPGAEHLRLSRRDAGRPARSRTSGGRAGRTIARQRAEASRSMYRPAHGRFRAATPCGHRGRAGEHDHFGRTRDRAATAARAGASDAARRDSATPSSIRGRRGAGDLFVALPGERADGHDFVADAAARGARGAIVAHEVAARDRAVRRARPARGAPGRWPPTAARRVPRLKVVGITGSVGKTTTKEIVASVLATKYARAEERGQSQQ